MSRDYNYDNEGQFFPYFILTLLGLFLVPLTYSTFAPSSNAKSTKIPLVKTGFVPPKHQLIETARRRQAKRERRIKRFISMVLGWGLFGYMVYLIITTKGGTSKIWDPYEILGISSSSNEKDIKKHYRKLAMKFHPDKVRPSGNDTVESLNDKFVEMTKAYKVLTDEEIRNNYALYGHPDGKQSYSIGIALPQWIVASENIYYVLAVYGVLFGILLPYTVGKWWYGTKRYTKDGVITESAGSLFKAYDPETDERRLVEVLPLGEEYKELDKTWGNIDDAAVEAKIKDVIGEKSFKRLQDMEAGPRRRALGLLWAYLYRVDLGSDKLESAKLDVAPPATVLLNSFLAISLAYGNTAPLLASMRVSQSLIQAIAPGESPLLQLPAFTPAIVAAVEQDGGKNHWSIKRFMTLSPQKRRQLCIGNDLLTETQYNQAIAFAEKLPALQVEAAFFKVAGEKFVTVSSLVQFVVKARIFPPGVELPPVEEKDLVDEDPDEGDVDALIGRKPNFTKPGTTKPSSPANNLLNPLAHAPYYPRDYSPRWHLFLADAKQGKMVIPPTTFTELEKTENGIHTLKLQFQAPPQKGEYTFVMHLVNDAYLGIDTKMNVRMVVEGPEKVTQMLAEEDEISEPDEDSIAGQMNAMRTGGAPVKKKKKAAADSDEEDSDEEEESDTDGEKGKVVEEDSETDTETDTDEE